MGKFIWLIGENLSKTADNNGYYFWRGAVKKKDDIDKYLVLEKNPDNVALYKSLPEYCKKFIVWRDTPEHLKLYIEADMFLD